MTDQLMSIKSLILTLLIITDIAMETLTVMNEIFQSIFYTMAIMVLSWTLYDKYKEYLSKKKKK